MAATDLLPAAAAARAKQLEFFARVRVEGYLKGLNRSTLKGRSTEFRQHRPYVPGDDLRHFDWRLFARSDRLMTREYDEYTSLDVVLVLDVSGSMGYGGDGLTKIAFAQHCAAMLAYLANRQRDRIALAAIADTVRDFLRPSQGKKHLAEVFTKLAALTPAGETDLAPCARQLAARLRRKSVLVFFSDCYQDPAALTRALGTLALQGHDLILYQIHDPAEEDLRFPGFTLFKDLESGRQDAADPLEIRNAYAGVFRSHLRGLQEGAGQFGIEFHSLATSSDWDYVFARLLHERMTRR